MQEKDGFIARERWLEESWFRKEEERKLEEHHARLAREADRERIGQATGITDQEALLAIQEIGFSAGTIALLPLIPPLEIAWMEGGITSREADYLTHCARQQGIEAGGEADQALTRLLSAQPVESFFPASRQALRAQLLASPPPDREQRREEILTHCQEVARLATSRFLGRQSVPDEIRHRIEQIRQELAPASQGTGRSPRTEGNS